MRIRKGKIKHLLYFCSIFLEVILMEKPYRKELLDEKIAFEINRENGLKAEKRFFSLTPEFLRDKCHVLPSDSLEEARKKIMAVVKSDAFLYDYFKKDRRDWYIRGIDEGFWTTPTKVEKVYTKEIGKILQDLKRKGWLKQGGQINNNIDNIISEFLASK